MPVSNLHSGIYRGTVTNISDPEGLLRIKARVPQVFGQAETNWIWPVIPVAVGVTTPAVGDPVWISFEAGDANRPVWMGVWMTNRPGGAAPDINFGGVVSETTYGLSPSNGIAQTLARSDHTHGSPAHTTTEHPAVTVVPVGPVTAEASYGLAPADGTALTLARSDHTHGSPPHTTAEHGAGVEVATGIPVDQALGDVAGEGAALTLARSDHRHGLFSTVAAASVTAGTFDAGDYTFPANLTVIGTLAASLPASSITAETFPAGQFNMPTLSVTTAFRAFSSVGAAIYVRNSSSVVEIGRYLDFHTTGVADEAADYSARFNCWSATDLDISGVNLHVPNGLVTAGSTTGRAYVGWHPVHGASWTSFGHYDHRNSSSAYCLMQHSNGETLLNCGGTGNRLRLAQSGATRMTIAGDVTVHSEMYCDNWFRSNTWGEGWFHQAGGGGWMMSDTTWVQSYGNKSVLVNSNSSVIRCGSAEIRTWSGSSGHATLCETDRSGDGYMMRHDGYMWIVCPQTLTFRMAGGDVMTLWNSGGWADFRANLPSIAGTTMVIAATSNQLGRSSSSRRFKHVLGELTSVLVDNTDTPVLEHSNPALTKFHPIRFHWNENVANAEEENPKYPGGLAGFIAEEIAEVTPDAVVYDEKGLPSELNTNAMLAYIVGGLQHVHRGGHKRLDRLNELEPKVEDLLKRVAAIENLPAIKPLFGKE